MVKKIPCSGRGLVQLYCFFCLFVGAGFLYKELTGIMKGLMRNIWNILNVIMDWFLIIVGTLLVAKALYTIDVAGARYIVVGVGVFFFTTGLWCRYRRKRRYRGEKS